MSIADALASAGKIPAAFAKDAPVGSVVQGTVVAANIRQCMGYDDDKPEFWDDARTQPKMQVVITIQTDQRDPGDEADDGRRNVYVKWWGDQRKTLAAAVKAAQDTDVRTGGMFAARKAGMTPSDNPKFNDAIIWEYRYQKPATGIDFAAAAAEQQQAVPQQQMQPNDFAQQNLMNGLGATPIATAPGDWTAQAGGAPAPAPVPAAAPPAPTAPGFDVNKVKEYLALGLGDDQIAAAVGTDAATVATIRNLP